MSDFLRIFRRFGVAIFCGIFLLSSLFQFAFERRFLLEPFAATRAVITAAEPYNHGRLYYDYTVGGSSFSGVGSGSLAPGSQMRVFYLRSDPSVSTDHDPTSGFAGLFGSAFGGAVFMSVGASLAAYFVARRVLARRIFSVPPHPIA